MSADELSAAWRSLNGIGNQSQCILLDNRWQNLLYLPFCNGGLILLEQFPLHWCF